MESNGKHKLVRYAVVLLVTIFLVPSFAGARMHGDGMPDRESNMKKHAMLHYGIWRNSTMVKSLGLTDQQVQQFKDAEFSEREKGLALKAQLDMLRLQMNKAFAEESPDEAAVLMLASQVADLQGQLSILKIKSRLTMEKLLNAEQRQKLKTEYDGHHGRRDYDSHHSIHGGPETNR